MGRGLPTNKVREVPLENNFQNMMYNPSGLGKRSESAKKFFVSKE